MLLVCILSYLKHFINPCKGNFLRREFWVFYIFCIYLIVTNWKNKTPPYAFFPRFAYWLKWLVQTPDTGSLGWIMGICRRAAGVHIDVLRFLCRAGTCGTGRVVRSRSSQVESPALHYPFSSCTESPALFSRQLSRHPWCLPGGQHVWDRSYFKKQKSESCSICLGQPKSSGPLLSTDTFWSTKASTVSLPIPLCFQMLSLLIKTVPFGFYPFLPFVLTLV